MDDRPLALSVEKVRHEMLRGLLIPRELVNEALRTVANKLRAKETKFFAFKGVVRDVREVDDHGTQLTAADQIFSLSGLYARERENPLAPPQVVLEVDSRTGVVRMVVGGLPGLEAPPSVQELPTMQPSLAESGVLNTPTQTREGALLAVPLRTQDELVARIIHDEVVD